MLCRAMKQNTLFVHCTGLSASICTCTRSVSAVDAAWRCNTVHNYLDRPAVLELGDLICVQAVNLQAA